MGRGFTAEFLHLARPARHAAGDRWFADETYVTVAGRWTYLCRAVDQHGQVIDVLVSTRRDVTAARPFFCSALRVGPVPVGGRDRPGPVYPRVLEQLVPAARHVSDRFATDTIEVDHSRLNARVGAMRGLKRLAAAPSIAAGHVFVQNLRRGHYAISVDLRQHDRVRAAFDELALVL